jgi:DNA-binding phage protein
MPSIPHDDLMRKYLADSSGAEAYINACLEDGNPWLIADAFRLVEQIHGKKLRFRVRSEAVLRRIPSTVRRTIRKRPRKTSA